MAHTRVTQEAPYGRIARRPLRNEFLADARPPHELQVALKLPQELVGLGLQHTELASELLGNPLLRGCHSPLVLGHRRSPERLRVGVVLQGLQTWREGGKGGREEGREGGREEKGGREGRKGREGKEGRREVGKGEGGERRKGGREEGGRGGRGREGGSGEWGGNEDLIIPMHWIHITLSSLCLEN